MYELFHLLRITRDMPGIKGNIFCISGFNESDAEYSGNMAFVTDSILLYDILNPKKVGMHEELDWVSEFDVYKGKSELFTEIFKWAILITIFIESLIKQ